MIGLVTLFTEDDKCQSKLFVVDKKINIKVNKYKILKKLKIYKK